MGYGNYKTEGGKGLNTPWQRAVLMLLSWLRAGESLPDDQTDLTKILEITDNTAHELFPAFPQGINAITDMVVTNGSLSTGTWVELREENASGTLLWKGYADANGGGFIQPSMKKPIFSKTINKAIVVVCSETGVDVVVSANGFKFII